MFIALLGTILMVASDTIPLFDNEVQEAQLNTELHEVTNTLLTNPGRTDSSTNWEQTPGNTRVLGLADNVGEVERSKVAALDDDSSSGSVINYTEFRELTGADNQYRFIFTWYPMVETHKTFTRSNSPEKILEPTGTEYSDDGNTVHYGSTMINGRNMKFLVTSHDQVYDTVYISRTWSFRDAEPRVRGEVVDIQGQDFTVQQFQNREDEPGNLVIFSSQIKDFGAPQAQASTVIKLNRYAVLKDIGSGDFPVKIEVLAW